jgi:hypothetical protein
MTKPNNQLDSRTTTVGKGGYPAGEGQKRIISSQHRKRGGHSLGGGTSSNPPRGTHALLSASLDLANEKVITRT